MVAERGHGPVSDRSGRHQTGFPPEHQALAGTPVGVHYVGCSWSTGDEFDSSWSRNELFGFELGAGQVISGWDQGVAGMRVGGRRRLTIPPRLGYGEHGAGGVIAPNETLVFVVDLFEVG